MTSMNSPRCHTCQLPLAQSTLSRPHHQCPFCRRSFGRVDGLRRHTKTCPTRGDRPLPPDVKRGRKVHACDTCSRIKVSCDSKTPCARCASRDLSCTYGRICADSSHRLKVVPSGKPPSIDNNSLQLSFLLAYTDPSVGTGDGVILVREPEHDPGQTAAWESADNHCTISDTIDPSLLFLGFTYPSFGMDLDCCSIDSDHIPNAADSTDLGISEEELRARVGQLEVDIRLVATAEPYVQNICETGSWAEFFVISSFQESIKAFFQREQLLATIIHKPTFCPEQVDTTLLLAIAISGYTYLHCRQGGTNFSPFVLALRELGEKYIFRRVEQLLGSTVPLVVSPQPLEVCQAAYIIETLQFCVKDAKTRQRTITRCHPMLVDLLRSINIVGSRHSLPGSEVDWHTFVCTESCIRLLHWVFINDAWFTLFSNRPPAMTFSDMSGHLPCDDRLWKADSPASFDSFKLQQEFSSSLSYLDALVSGLLGDEWTGSTVASYTRLDIKHFLVLILGMFLVSHYII